MRRHHHRNNRHTTVIALIAFLIMGGVLGYLLYQDSNKVVTVEVDGVTYTVDEYNRKLAQEHQAQIEEENKKKEAERAEAEKKKQEEEAIALERKNARFLTLIDDDGYVTFTEKLLPIVIEKNVSISMAIETGKAGTGEFMSWETIADNHAAGAEVLNHSRWHIYSKEESEKRDKAEVKKEMLGSIQDLIDHGYEDTADIYIYPGASAGSTWSVAQEVFRVGINSSGNEVNQIPFSQFNMHRYPIGSTHVPDFEEMKGYIDEVAPSGGWEIWMMHSHNGYMTDEYIEALKQAIDYCDEVGVQIVSAKYALDYFDIQKRE